MGRQLRPPAGFAEAVLGLQTQLPAGKGARRESSRSGSGLRFLCLSLSLLFLSVFKSHYMGFCSFGTSSSFQICPGTSRAVTGMLRTWSVDDRDCTNERIQALLVSRGGIRHLPLPLSFFTLCPPSTSHPPESLLQRGPSPSRGSKGLRWGPHALQSWITLQLIPASVPLLDFLPASPWVLWKLGGCGESQLQLKKFSNFEGVRGRAHRGNLIKRDPFNEVLCDRTRLVVHSYSPYTRRGLSHPAS